MKCMVEGNQICVYAFVSVSAYTAKLVLYHTDTQFSRVSRMKGGRYRALIILNL